MSTSTTAVHTSTSVPPLRSSGSACGVPPACSLSVCSSSHTSCTAISHMSAHRQKRSSRSTKAIECGS